MSRPLHKVTTFITRHRGNETDLLLFRHGSAGIQIPGGTVEEGEATDNAALREGREETDLDALTLIAKIGSFD
jgi:ADP-ribose pyrophosphatase YjhB (NUDIX family)